MLRAPAPYQVLSGRHAGKWRGSLLVTDADGAKVRKYLQADTSADVVARMQTAQEDADRAAALADSPTLEWWATRWLSLGSKAYCSHSRNRSM